MKTLACPLACLLVIFAFRCVGNLSEPISQLLLVLHFWDDFAFSLRSFYLVRQTCSVFRIGPRKPLQLVKVSSMYKRRGREIFIPPLWDAADMKASGYGSRRLVMYLLFSLSSLPAYCMLFVGFWMPAYMTSHDRNEPVYFKIRSGIVHLHIKGNFAGRRQIWGSKSFVIIVMLICIHSCI